MGKGGLCGCVGVLVGFSLVVPSFSSMSTGSFPVIHECARTLCGVQYICRTMAAISSFFEWWCCDGGRWI